MDEKEKVEVSTIEENKPQEVDYEALINEKTSNFIKIEDVDKIVNETVLKTLRDVEIKPESKDEGLEEIWVID